MIPETLRRAAPDGADVAVRAPGRANLIGEHTDYNDGFVLPVALDIATWVLGRRGGPEIRIRSMQQEEVIAVGVESRPEPVAGWGRYVAAVIHALRDAGVAVAGFDGVLDSDIPAGSGLSSSAALEVAVALAVAPDPPGPVDLAQICRRAENEYVGVATGIMDQLACAGGRAGHALLIDCRDNSMEPVPVSGEMAVVVIDSAVRRGLGDSAYNERREQCRAAARALGVRSLRDVGMSDLERTNLDPVVLRRARHVVSENERVLEVAAALRRGVTTSLGRLFEASHRSLAKDYEVSVPELDTLVAIARATPGVIAARLTGAGFGGCTVNLVDRPNAAHAARHIVGRYERETSKQAQYWVSAPSDGAARVAVHE